jgi:Holliday junction resolvase-like predicted endonuclease
MPADATLRRRRAHGRGHRGEWLAALALILKGYRVLARRHKTRLGEVDLIARRGDLIIMVEVKARPSLAEAMDAFCQQSARKEFRIVLEAIRHDVYAGEPFSIAMARWPRVFPRLMVSLMKASEASGTMAMMLGRISDWKKSLRQRHHGLSSQGLGRLENDRLVPQKQE